MGVIPLSDFSGACRIWGRVVEDIQSNFIEQLVSVGPWIGIFGKRNLIFQFGQSTLDSQIN